MTEAPGAGPADSEAADGKAVDGKVGDSKVAGIKAAGALRTIGEVSRDLGVAQHILRFWETRFPQLRPLQRSGQRRYYRPEDVALVQRIDALLNRDGYTIRGVQQLLAAEATPRRPDLPGRLRRIRDSLAAALLADER